MAQQDDGQQAKNKNGQPNEKLTFKQKQKQDALELAELIYDIFKGSLSNGTIESGSRKDKQDV